MYDLFLDDPKSIKCKAEISGAKTEDSKVRLMVETPGRCFYFKGSINSSGDIEIPINSLKGLISESTQGKMLLELVIEDTLFIPWKTDFIAKLKKKVSVTEIREEVKEILPVILKPEVKLVIEEEKEITPEPAIVPEPVIVPEPETIPELEITPESEVIEEEDIDLGLDFNSLLEEDIEVDLDLLEESSNKEHINNLVQILEAYNIDILNINENKTKVGKLINEYFKTHLLPSKDILEIKQGLMDKLIEL
jgi:hypothetical protein